MLIIDDLISETVPITHTTNHADNAKVSAGNEADADRVISICYSPSGATSNQVEHGRRRQLYGHHFTYKSRLRMSS